MTHWQDLSDISVPDVDEWGRDDYDALAALSPEDLLRIAWNLRGHYGDLEWQWLDFAQDLSFEFEVQDIAYVRDEYRQEEAERRQAAGIDFMLRAYAAAGFTEDRRAQIKAAAAELTETGLTVLDQARGNAGSDG